MNRPPAAAPVVSLPPPFQPVCCGPSDALLRAVAEAEAGAGAATLVHGTRPDRFDVAVVFEPDLPLARARCIGPVMMLAMADALSTLGPPQKDPQVDWPDRILVDGALVGGVAVTAAALSAEEAVPDWLVAGVKLRLSFPADLGDPGRTPERTALYEEGFGAVEPLALLESFSRHLLLHVSRLLEEGFAPLAQDWLTRLPPARTQGPVRHGLDPQTGDLLLLEPGSTRPRRESLAAAQARPRWTL